MVSSMEGLPPDDGSLASGLERSRRPTPHVRVVVALLAILVVASTAAVFLNPPAPPPQPPPPVGPPSYPTPYPTLVRQVGSGVFNLTLPLMISHNPDNASIPNVTFASYVSFSSGYNGISAINYTWSNITGTQMPVRFLLDSSQTGYRAGLQWFVWWPAGACDTGCAERLGWSVPLENVTLVAYTTVYTSYTVYEVTLAPPLESFSWLDVVYHFGGSSTGGTYIGSFCYCDEPFTEPSAAELRAVGPPLALGMDSLRPAAYHWDVSDFVDPSEVFHAVLSPRSFNAGPYGVIRAQPVSSFSWGTASRGNFRVEGTADHNLTIQMYIDTRFGGLYPVLLT